MIACARTKSIPSYRYAIKQRATTVTDSFATKVVVYQKVPRKIFLFDFVTRYQGYYASDTKAVITDKRTVTVCSHTANGVSARKMFKKSQ